jgi:hypothetical protein
LQLIINIKKSKYVQGHRKKNKFCRNILQCESVSGEMWIVQEKAEFVFGMQNWNSLGDFNFSGENYIQEKKHQIVRLWNIFLKEFKETGCTYFICSSQYSIYVSFLRSQVFIRWHTSIYFTCFDSHTSHHQELYGHRFKFCNWTLIRILILLESMYTWLEYAYNVYHYKLQR